MGKGVKIKAPKIKVGKDLGLKNIGKGVSALAKTAGKVGSQVVKTTGKGLEGIGKNTFDIAGAVAKGDLKGIGKEGLELLQSGKDIAKGYGSAALTANTGVLGATGAATGSKAISKAAEDINREGNKGINKYGDAAIDAAISAVPGAGQAYALAKMGLGATAKDGIKGLLSGKGLTDAAVGAVASKFGYDPNMLKMGLSAAQGDLKGAALQGLGSFGGMDPNMLKMGAAALSGDKGGLASGLASQFGAGDSAASMLGAVAGGKKNDMVSALGGQLGLDPKMSSMLGAAAGGDLKGAALKQLAGATGLDPKLVSGLTQGKMDPMELVRGVSSLTSNAGRSPQGQGEKGILDNLKEGVSSGLGKIGDFFSGDKSPEAPSSYTINKGDTFGAIAKKMGVSVEQLRAANPNITDPNKIAAGAKLNLPTAAPEKGFLDKAGDFLSSAGGKAGNLLGGAGSAVMNFAANNPNLVEGAVQLGGAKIGYDITKESAAKQQEILARQEAEANQIREMEKFQFDPRRSQAYDQSYGFQQDIIKEGGFTGAEKAQQREDDLRAAKMRQAAKMAGERTLAEKGQGSTGSGQAYASMLAGQQEAADVGTQLDLARQKQAAENLRGAYKELPEMMERKSTPEMDLAQRRSTEDVNRATQLEAVRKQQTAAEQARAEALGKLAGKATDTVSGMVKKGLESYKTSQDELKAKAEADKLKAEQAKKTPNRTPGSTNVKAGAAGQIAGNTPPANMATGEFGSGAGVLATPNADAMNQALKRSTPIPQPKSGAEQLLSGNLQTQGQQPMMSTAPAPNQQMMSVDPNKQLNKPKF
jgi:LysM repeat protein